MNERIHKSASIDILLVAAALLEFGYERNRLVGFARTMGRHDVDQRALDVLGHSLAIAADVNVSALGKPSPQVAADLAHAVLHVDFLIAVARPGKREPGQHACRLHRGQFVLVKEVISAALVAEEQPISSAGSRRHALLKKGAERRNSGAGTDHDDGHGGIG